MNNNIFLKVAGVITCVVALGLNLQYACDGYGVKTSSLHHEVLAQTNSDSGSSSGGSSSGGSSSGGSSSGGSSSGGSSSDDDEGGGSTSGSSGGLLNPWFWKQVPTRKDCEAVIVDNGTSSRGISITVALPGATPINLGTEWHSSSGIASTTTYKGKLHECYDGWEMWSCTPRCVAD